MSDRKGQLTPGSKPGFFYGYIVVLAGFFITMLSQGGRPAFGIFFKPMLTDFGWTRTLTSGAFSLSMAMEGIMSIVMGGLNDRFGPRVVVAISGLLLGLGYLLMSLISASWQLYLLYGVLVGAGLGGSIVPLMSTVVRWFTRRRSVMTGIVLTGSGLGYLIMPPVAERLISAYDWRTSYLILGGAALVVIVVAAQFLKSDPETTGYMPYNGGQPAEPFVELEGKGASFVDVLRTRQFWTIFGMLVTHGFTSWAIAVHFAPYFTDLGNPASTAANILASRGGAMVVGTVILGNIADRAGTGKINVSGFALIMVALFFLLICKEVWMFFLFFILLGLGNGGVAATISPLTAELFGLRSHGLIFGTLGLGYTIGAAIGPLVAGYTFDVTDSYQIAFIVSAAVGVVGLILSLLLARWKKKFTVQMADSRK